MVCGFAFAFVACGGGNKEEAKDAETTETPAVAPDTTATDTTATDTTSQQ